MDNFQDIFNLSNDDFVEKSTSRESEFYKPSAKDGKDNVYKSLIRFIPWHLDPRGNVDWLIGTKGDRIVRLRQSKDNAISYANVSVTDAQKAYNLAFAFDANFFDYWQHDLTIQQYKLGALAAARKAEQVKAREAEAKAKAAKTAPKPSAPAAKKTTVRVTRKSKASTASK
jgi:hypothetical protein